MYKNFLETIIVSTEKWAKDMKDKHQNVNSKHGKMLSIMIDQIKQV